MYTEWQSRYLMSCKMTETNNEIKYFPCTYAPFHEGICRCEVEVHTFFISVLAWDEWMSSSIRLISKKEIEITVILIPLVYRNMTSHLIDHGSCILHDTCFPVLVCCVHREIMECDTQRKWMFWFCHLIFIANVNVSDLHLHILYDLCCKLLHKRIIWFWFICNNVTISY